MCIVNSINGSGFREIKGVRGDDNTPLTIAGKLGENTVHVYNKDAKEVGKIDIESVKEDRAELFSSEVGDEYRFWRNVGRLLGLGT